MVLFVGDKPSRAMLPGARAFQGAKCEKRLMDWVNALTDFTSDVKFVNQCENCFYDIAIKAYRENTPIVALGNNASKALLDIPHFKLPHPSGKNFQCNDKEFVEQKLKECKKWLDQHK